MRLDTLLGEDPPQLVARVLVSGALDIEELLLAAVGGLYAWYRRSPRGGDEGEAQAWLRSLVGQWRGDDATTTTTADRQSHAGLRGGDDGGQDGAAPHACPHAAIETALGWPRRRCPDM